MINKELIPKVNKQLKTNKTKTNLILKRLEDLNRHSFQEHIQMVNRLMKRCSTSQGKDKSKPQGDIASRLSKWLSSETPQIVNIVEDVEKRELWYTLGENVNLCSHYRKQNWIISIEKKKKVGKGFHSNCFHKTCSRRLMLRKSP